VTVTFALLSRLWHLLDPQWHLTELIRIFDCYSHIVEKMPMGNQRPLTIERESAILDAAQKRFAHFGISKVTMDEVAADVGLKKASLYYYFRTKEDLFLAVIEREEKGYVSLLQGISAETASPAEKLHLFGMKRLDLFASLLNLAQFKVDSWTAMQPTFQVMFRKIEGEEHRFLTGLLEEGISRGEFHIREVDKTATLILHLLLGLRLRLIVKTKSPDIDPANYAELRRETDLLLELLLHGFVQKEQPTLTSRASYA
jgi:TetR/AcrR family transcriptional regulator